MVNKVSSTVAVTRLMYVLLFYHVSNRTDRLLLDLLTKSDDQGWDSHGKKAEEVIVM